MLAGPPRHTNEAGISALTRKVGAGRAKTAGQCFNCMLPRALRLEGGSRATAVALDTFKRRAVSEASKTPRVVPFHFLSASMGLRSRIAMPKRTKALCPEVALPSWEPGDVLGLALDFAAGKMRLSHQGKWQAETEVLWPQAS